MPDSAVHPPRWPDPDWTVLRRPAEAGWSTAGLARVDALAEAIGTAALMVVEAGVVVHRWGATEHRYMCHSIRKSLLSALYGIYVAEGRIDISRTLADLAVDDVDGLTVRERMASIGDLLMARSGIYHPTGHETPNMQATREPRHSHGPGTFWCYNNWDFNALGTIFENCAGIGIFEAFRDRIAGPCGFEDFRYDDAARDGAYVEFPHTVHRAYPFRMSTRDLARFGLLFLREGRWGERRIVPEKWVRLSVQPYSHAGVAGAYGFMWWVVRDGIHFPGAIMPRGYSARGAGGHVLMILPDQDLVIVHRVDTDARHEVGSHKIGQLFEAILDARGAGGGMGAI